MAPYRIFLITFWDGKEEKAFVGEYTLEGAINKFQTSIPNKEILKIESTGTGNFIS